MAPAVGDLPAAEREVDVSGPVAEFLQSLSPRMLTRIRLALRTFEWLPFPWRFSRLDLATREDFLHRMEGSRFGLHHQLLLMAKTFTTLGYAIDPRVEGLLGLETSCRLADGSPPEPAGPLGDTRPPAEGEECDVVIVGSGAGGAVAAAVLAEAGLDVVVLEAGDSYDRETYPQNPLDAIASLYRDGGLTIAEGRPPIPVPVARTVGGTTVINSGTCFRAPDPVLEHWRERYGIAWADRLAPDFAEAEEFLRVTPVDPERMGRNGQLAMEGAAAIGASGGPISRNAGDCVQCSSCPYGCRIDAKRGMHVSYL
ncbi:MAG: GMC family oxidoreductase N-terminal domain-containing protein, partial [Solirubrobacterales bacterium]